MARILNNFVHRLMVAHQSTRFFALKLPESVNKIPYGISSLSEYRHIRIFSDLGLTSDSVPDRFHSLEEFNNISNLFSKNNRDIHNALAAALTLKRLKFAISLLDFALNNNFLEKRTLKLAINILAEAFLHQEISKKEGKIIAEKMSPLILNSSEILQKDFKAGLSNFYEDIPDNRPIFVNSTGVFLSRMIDAVRNKDLRKVEQEWKQFPGDVIQGTIVYDDYVQWMASDNSVAPRLFTLLMDSVVNSGRSMDSDTFEKYFLSLNKISSLPKWNICDLNNSKCNQCGETFKPKPLISNDEWNKLSAYIDEYAKSLECESSNKLVRITKKLKQMHESDPLKRPVCYMDVANVAYGKHNYLGNVNKVVDFIGKIYEHFSAIALVSKFSIPVSCLQELNQLRTVIHFTKNFHDDVTILQLYTRGERDGYIITNDFFRDHCFGVSEIDKSHLLSKAIELRSLRFKENVVERPTEVSPFAQKTTTGFHLPVRSQQLKNTNAYEYYCCRGLF